MTTATLPEIDPGLLKPGPIVVMPTTEPDLKKVDLTDVALAQFGDWRKAVDDTKATLRGVVLDLSTQAKVDEAKGLRQRLINAPIADVRKVSKVLKSKLSQVSKRIGEEEEAAVEAYTQAAGLISPQIDARQAELDAEREAKRLAEVRRVNGLQEKLAGLSNWIERCREPGMTAERIHNGIHALTVLELTPEDWQEFHGRALARKDEVLEVMRELHRQAVQREHEAAETERLRALAEKQAAELAELRAKERQRAASEQFGKALAAAVARVGIESVNAALGVFIGRTTPFTTDEMEQHVATLDALQPKITTPPEQVGGQVDGCRAPESQPDGCSGPVPQDQTSLPASPVTQDAQESGLCAGTPAVCASSEAESAQASPSGDEGPVAHADTSAADPAPASFKPSDHYVGPVELRHLRTPYDLEREAAALVEHLAKAFDSRFPSHPKPEKAWWDALRERMDAIKDLLPEGA